MTTLMNQEIDCKLKCVWFVTLAVYGSFWVSDNPEFHVFTHAFCCCYILLLQRLSLSTLYVCVRCRFFNFLLALEFLIPIFHEKFIFDGIVACRKHKTTCKTSKPRESMLFCTRYTVATFNIIIKLLFVLFTFVLTTHSSCSKWIQNSSYTKHNFFSRSVIVIIIYVVQFFHSSCFEYIFSVSLSLYLFSMHLISFSFVFYSSFCFLFFCFHIPYFRRKCSA